MLERFAFECSGFGSLARSVSEETPRSRFGLVTVDRYTQMQTALGKFFFRTINDDCLVGQR